MQKKIRIMITVLACLCAFSVHAAADTKRDSVEVENRVSMGYTNIALTEYEYDNGGQLSPCEDCTEVLPGETLSRIARITNLADAVWIRLKVTFPEESGLPGSGENIMTGSNPEWLRIGDYYYRTEPLEKDVCTDFDVSIHIPEEWDGQYAGRSFRMLLRADAVQERNFDPDFRSEDPWFGTVIEKSVESAYEAKTVPKGANFSILYKGGAEGLVRVGEDFFSNWSELLPGDIRKDTATIGSSYPEAVKIWFYTRTEAANSLADQLLLAVSNEGESVFRGPLSESSERVLLGEYRNGEKSTLEYTLYVPEELGNAYALEDAKTVWVFECEITGSEVPGKGGGVPTGDPARQIPYLAAAVGSGGLIFLILWKQIRTGKRRRRRRRQPG